MRDILSIRQVHTPSERRIFLTFPWRIYRDDPLWVPPLLPERQKNIDPDQGAFFQRGYAEFFTAWRDSELVGTICAAEDVKTNQQRGRKECLFGFFEYIKDYEVAAALLDHIRNWARQRHLETLFGPYNLDYEDSYGILVEGRDRPPALLCGHTPPYYLDFMERYGFQPARGDNLAFALPLDGDSPALKLLSLGADRVRQVGHITIRQADFTHWQDEVDHVYSLINIALAHLPDFIPWQREALQATMRPFLHIADPELTLFAETGGKVVGFLPGLPNLNEAFIHASGLRRPWNYLSLWWHMRRKFECLAIKSVLVLPEYWGGGAAILLFAEMIERARAKGYKWLDLSLTSADNLKTPQLAERLGAKVYKRYRVLRLKI